VKTTEGKRRDWVHTFGKNKRKLKSYSDTQYLGLQTGRQNTGEAYFYDAEAFQLYSTFTVKCKTRDMKNIANTAEF
jgi:hypothetical protein